MCLEGAGRLSRGRGRIVAAWGSLGGRWDDVRARWMREVMRDRACLMMSRWDDDRFVLMLVLVMMERDAIGG